MPMTPARASRHALPPFWLPVLAGLPLGVCLLVMAMPILGHGNATLARTLYLSAFVLWVLPLTALQRWLWRRGMAVWRIALVLLLATYAMALATRLLSVALQAATSGSLARLVAPGTLDVGLLFRGLEGAWLVLVNAGPAAVPFALPAGSWQWRLATDDPAPDAAPRQSHAGTVEVPRSSLRIARR